MNKNLWLTLALCGSWGLFLKSDDSAAVLSEADNTFDAANPALDFVGAQTFDGNVVPSGNVSSQSIDDILNASSTPNVADGPALPQPQAEGEAVVGPEVLPVEDPSVANSAVSSDNPDNSDNPDAGTSDI